MFEKSHRPGGELYTRLREDAPDWLRDAVYEAHDDETPNDWRYEKCAEIWENITSEDEAHEPHELTDHLTDIYTGDLLAWLTPGRVHYVDKVLEEWPEVKCFATILHTAQAYAIDQMIGVLLWAHNDNAEEAA
jgi:hypothetical protein